MSHLHGVGKLFPLRGSRVSVDVSIKFFGILAVWRGRFGGNSALFWMATQDMRGNTAQEVFGLSRYALICRIHICLELTQLTREAFRPSKASSVFFPITLPNIRVPAVFANSCHMRCFHCNGAGFISPFVTTKSRFCFAAYVRTR